ncbi:uncharacterized protein LOC128391428 isoform X2 [Panonychus citri]|uniref:uncharacterized protein LOC128391428 isoform X2 n=1 Tax=Panonychus citri TaxID=50023 RepID=UPI0023079534|nr:uncharacterized protein LOC128391428 isoform X2 [Panonychus citri]
MDLKRKLLKIDSIIISSNIIIIVLLNITRSNCQSRFLYSSVQIYEHCYNNHTIYPDSFYLVHDRDNDISLPNCHITLEIDRFVRINIHVRHLKMTNMVIDIAEATCHDGPHILSHVLIDDQEDFISVSPGLVPNVVIINPRILDASFPGKINANITVTLYQKVYNERQCHELGSTNLFCGNGQCLSEYFRCDGVENCLFGHDEKNCSNQPWLLILLSISTAIMFLIISSALIWFGWTKIMITRKIVTTAKSSKTVDLENHHSLSI